MNKPKLIPILALACAAFLSMRVPAQNLAHLPPMPEGVTSFGAITHDGWLYTFGGHKGKRHHYTAEMVSGAFHRLRLGPGESWEVLPSSAPGQGLAIVAHRGRIYRLGGMAAENRNGEKEHLVSSALVQRFDPGAALWEEIAPLPAPRSSHDATTLGDKLYIFGGWELRGEDREAIWPANGLVLDLAEPGSGWRKIRQPFQRRALALASLDNRIYCIGGMDSNDKTTLAVEIYDTSTGQWSKGPDLPDGKAKGFGCSAIAQNGRVYASTFQGDLLCLTEEGQEWQAVGRLEPPRIAHRIVAGNNGQIIVLGGEDGKSKRPELGVFTPDFTKQTASSY